MDLFLVFFGFSAYLRAYVESQGFVDRKRGRPLHGRARAIIKVNGRDYSLHRRGIDVVVLDGRTGKELMFYHYRQLFHYL